MREEEKRFQSRRFVYMCDLGVSEKGTVASAGAEGRVHRAKVIQRRIVQ